jgi:hypothetical protein
VEHASPEGTRPPEYVVALWVAKELRARNARIQMSLAEALSAGKPSPEDQLERQAEDREAGPDQRCHRAAHRRVTHPAFLRKGLQPTAHAHRRTRGSADRAFIR